MVPRVGSLLLCRLEYGPTYGIYNVQWHHITARIKLCFRSLAGAEPEMDTLSAWDISQLCSVFNHMMFILGFKHLNTSKTMHL